MSPTVILPSLHPPPSKTSLTLATGASRPTRRIANAYVRTRNANDKTRNTNDKMQRILQGWFATATQLVAQGDAQEQLVAQEAPQEVVMRATRDFR
jgi:uncharacterized protein YcbX